MSVDGEQGTESTATFTAPLDVTEIQRTVVTEGDEPLTAGEFVPEVALEYPDALRALHVDYQRAGSDVVEVAGRRCTTAMATALAIAADELPQVGPPTPRP